jgi:hypothetical protein
MQPCSLPAALSQHTSPSGAARSTCKSLTVAAGMVLVQAGYGNLVDVGTGYSGWAAAGLPVEQ